MYKMYYIIFSGTDTAYFTNYFQFVIWKAVIKINSKNKRLHWNTT